MDSILDRIRVLEKKVEEGAVSLSEEQLAVLAGKMTEESLGMQRRQRKRL